MKGCRHQSTMNPSYSPTNCPPIVTLAPQLAPVGHGAMQVHKPCLSNDGRWIALINHASPISQMTANKQDRQSCSLDKFSREMFTREVSSMKATPSLSSHRLKLIPTSGSAILLPIHDLSSKKDSFVSR